MRALAGIATEVLALAAALAYANTMQSGWLLLAVILAATGLAIDTLIKKA